MGLGYDPSKHGCSEKSRSLQSVELFTDKDESCNTSSQEIFAGATGSHDSLVTSTLWHAGHVLAKAQLSPTELATYRVYPAAKVYRKR